MSESSSANSQQRPGPLHLSATSPSPHPPSDNSPAMDSSAFSSLSHPVSDSSAAPLSPLNPTTKKRLRSSDLPVPDGDETQSSVVSPTMQQRVTSPGSPDSPTVSSPAASPVSSIAGRRPASTSSLSALAAGKDNSDLQRLLDESDDEEDDEADDADEDGDEGSEEKSPVSTPHSVLTPLSSMAAAAAASSASYSPTPSPLTTAVQPTVVPTPLPMSRSVSASSSGASGGTEFSSQLFVIYMPKNNFKRFVVSSLNTMIIKASKTEKGMPRANIPAIPSRSTAGSGSSSSGSSSSNSRPPIPPLASSHSAFASSAGSAAAGPTSPSAAKKPLPSASFSSSSVSEQDNYTYNVAMEDVIACLQAHGVTYNPSFMWMDLSDFGQRFVQQMMDNNKAGADGAQSPTADAQPANDTYGGLWYNVAHKSHLVVNYFAHPFLGEGYAVVITLDLLDGNKDLSNLSQAAMAESQTQTLTISNDTLYKATRNINEGGITAHPAILTAASTTPAPTSLTTLTPFPLPSLALPADPPREGGRRKVRPVESIGEMLDRIAEYQRIRLQVKSKNKACERLGYSKGTINAYREKVKQALNLGIDLNQVRQTKYRDFKRVLEAAQAGGGAGGGVVGATGSPSSVKGEKGSSSGSSGGGLKSKKGEDGLKRKSNSFGDLGMALMAKQDARNGGRKAKAEVDADGKRTDNDDSGEDESGGGDGTIGSAKQSSFGRHRKQRSPGKMHEVGMSALPMSGNMSIATSSPPQHTHHLQPLLTSAAFSPATGHSQLAYIAPTAQHSTFTATPLPAGTTYVLSQPTGQPINASFSSPAFPQYSQAQFGGATTVFASPGGGQQFQPGSVVRTANGATYQITGSMTQVQMANVQSVQQQQTAFTRFM